MKYFLVNSYCCLPKAQPEAYVKKREWVLDVTNLIMSIATFSFI